MHREVPPAWLNEVAADPELRRLVRALSLSRRFHFYLLICKAPIVAEAALEELEYRVAAVRSSVRLVRLDPYSALEHPMQSMQSMTVDVLLREVQAWLVAPRPEDAARGVIHVVDASRALPCDGEAWKKLFQRMNERRNVIAARLAGELVLSLPLWLEPWFAQAAPDFWSIRSGEMKLAVGPPPVDDVMLSTLEEMRLRTDEPQRTELKEAADMLREALTAAAAQPLQSLESTLQGQDVDVSALRSRAIVLEREAAALKQMTMTDGQIPGDVAMLREAVALRRVVAGMESRESARRELAWSLVALGNAELDHAALSEAMAAYEEALTIFREMLQHEPDRPEWQHDLSICLNRMGDVHKARGALDEALSTYQESLVLRRHLVQREPERPEWWRDLSASLERVGTIHESRGALDKALSAYQESLALRRRLLHREPDQLQLQHDISSSLTQIGDLHYARGDLDEALSAYQESLALRRRLVQREPERPDWLQHLSLNLERIGHTRWARGEPWSARAATEEALELTRDLLERFPGGAREQSDFARLTALLNGIQRGHSAQKG